MDRRAESAAERIGAEPGMVPPADDFPGAGEGGTPSLVLDGFSGPLDHLLTLARARKFDLSEISLAGLVDQLIGAMRQAPATVPLGQKGDWVAMTAWLLQLRSLLLLPAEAPAQQEAAAEAHELRERLVAFEETQALAGWLARRPQLGHEVFARGAPEIFETAAEAAPAIDAIEFLWASMALFEDPAGPEAMPLYRPRRFEFYTAADARDRIRRRLAEIPGGAPLDWFLPDPPEAPENEARMDLRRRSAWSSTLIASLELARQAALVLEQAGDFQDIHVAPA